LPKNHQLMQYYKALRSILLLFLMALLPGLGQAQPDSPYHLSFEREAYYMGGGLSVTLLGFYLKANTPRLKLSDLDLGKVNSFDRIATTYSSEKADRLSDHTMNLSIGLSLFLLANEKSRNDFGKVSLLFIETMLWNQGFTDIIKSTSRRPRPYIFDENIDPAKVLSTNDRASFVSGHTSGAASAAFFFARTFSDYYPDSPWRPYIWAISVTLPALTGYLRVRGGQHYPTDVMAGYVLGGAIGYLIPTLHKKPLKIKGLSLRPARQGLHLSFRF